MSCALLTTQGTEAMKHMNTTVLNVLNENFIIPEDLQSSTPCLTKSELYWSPALDIDMDDDEWVRMSRDEQVAALEAKTRAEEAAVDACMDCPLMMSCRKWALEQGQSVHGVVGGLTQEERGGHVTRVTISDPTDRGPQGQVRDDLIERWVNAGITNRVIAERLGCNIRTVERRRAGMAKGKIVRYTERANGSESVSPAILAVTASNAAPAQARDAAQASLQPGRVSPETAAVYDALLDGGLRDRTEIVTIALPHVDKATALKTAPSGRKYADVEAKIAVGARKFIMNRIDIAVRRGRIQAITTDQGKVLICLSPDTAASWSAHRTGAGVAA